MVGRHTRVIVEAAPHLRPGVTRPGGECSKSATDLFSSNRADTCRVTDSKPRDPVIAQQMQRP